LHLTICSALVKNLRLTVSFSALSFKLFAQQRYFLINIHNAL